MPDFRFLIKASVLASHYSASVSSVPFLLIPPHSGLLSVRLPLSLLTFSPFFPAWSPMLFFPGSGTQLPVCFLSPFPDSLPQLFLRCFPYAFAFGLSPSDPLPFVRFSSGSGYSASASSVPFFLIPPRSGFLSASVLPFGLPALCFLFRLVSRASFPASGTWLSVCFLSSFPASLPQLLTPVLPFFSASSRPLHFRAFLLAFRFLSSASARF